MSASLIDIRVDNGVALVTLDAPARRNALSTPMMEALWDMHERLESMEGLRVVVLTGAGEAFCAGGSLDEMAGRTGVFGADDAAHARRLNLDVVHKIPRAVYGLTMPTIAAVNGAAIGGGCDLALMCDIRLASDRALFAESFIRAGLVPGDGGTWFLPRVVGQAKAVELTLTGEVIDAAEALRIGLVSRVVPHETLMDEALQLAHRIAAQPPMVTRLTKALLRFSAGATLPEALDKTAALQALAQTSDEHRAAVAALVGRLRKPDRG